MLFFLVSPCRSLPLSCFLEHTFLQMHSLLVRICSATLLLWDGMHIFRPLSTLAAIHVHAGNVPTLVLPRDFDITSAHWTALSGLRLLSLPHRRKTAFRSTSF